MNNSRDPRRAVQVVHQVLVGKYLLVNYLETLEMLRQQAYSQEHLGIVFFLKGLTADS